MVRSSPRITLSDFWYRCKKRSATSAIPTSQAESFVFPSASKAQLSRKPSSDTWRHRDHMLHSCRATWTSWPISMGLRMMNWWIFSFRSNSWLFVSGSSVAIQYVSRSIPAIVWHAPSRTLVVCTPQKEVSAGVVHAWSKHFPILPKLTTELTC